jgi:hypothetical protein
MVSMGRRALSRVTPLVGTPGHGGHHLLFPYHGFTAIGLLQVRLGLD